MDKDTKKIKKLLKLNPPTTKEERCNVCDKIAREVNILVLIKKTPKFLLCDQCIELCNEIRLNPKKFNPPKNPITTEKN